jgi:hypothetical protein
MDPTRVHRRLAEMGGQAPAALTRGVIDWARAQSGDGALRDDVALLAISFEEKPGPLVAAPAVRPPLRTMATA